MYAPRVEGEPQSAKIRNALKSFASRSWNRPGRDGPDRKRWARHGSTRWLWKDQDVRKAIRYVVAEHGEDRAVFVGGDLRRRTLPLSVASHVSVSIPVHVAHPGRSASD